MLLLVTFPGLSSVKQCFCLKCAFFLTVRRDKYLISEIFLSASCIHSFIWILPLAFGKLIKHINNGSQNCEFASTNWKLSCLCLHMDVLALLMFSGNAVLGVREKWFRYTEVFLILDLIWLTIFNKLVANKCTMFFLDRLY